MPGNYTATSSYSLSPPPYQSKSYTSNSKDYGSRKLSSYDTSSSRERITSSIYGGSSGLTSYRSSNLTSSPTTNSIYSSRRHINSISTTGVSDKTTTPISSYSSSRLSINDKYSSYTSSRSRDSGLGIGSSSRLPPIHKNSGFTLPSTSSTALSSRHQSSTVTESLSRSRAKFDSLSISERSERVDSSRPSRLESRVSRYSTKSPNRVRLKSRDRNRSSERLTRSSREESPKKFSLPSSGTISTTTSSTQSGNTGLRNLGNTCFMNSIIQCLSNTKPLRDYFISGKYKSDLKKRSGVATAFGEVISTIWSQSSSSTSPASLKRQIESVAPQFSGYRQHDSQELLLALLDGIHEDLNHCNRSAHKYVDTSKMPLEKQATVSWEQYCLRDYSKLVEIFVGQIVSTLTCLTCNEVSTVFEYFWDLSVPVASSVDSCLSQFTKSETLDGDERPSCDNCKTRRKMTKQYRLWRLPQILIIHLKRFKGGGRIRSKDSTNVKLDLNLSVSPYLHQKVSSVLGSQKSSYSLYAVSNHSGGTGGGHYTASGRHDITGEWRYFNDSSVNSISSSNVQTSDAYVLFYTRG